MNASNFISRAVSVKAYLATIILLSFDLEPWGLCRFQIQPHVAQPFAAFFLSPGSHIYISHLNVSNPDIAFECIMVPPFPLCVVHLSSSRTSYCSYVTVSTLKYAGSSCGPKHYCKGLISPASSSRQIHFHEVSKLFQSVGPGRTGRRLVSLACAFAKCLAYDGLLGREVGGRVD